MKHSLRCNNIRNWSRSDTTCTLSVLSPSASSLRLFLLVVHLLTLSIRKFRIHIHHQVKAAVLDYKEIVAEVDRLKKQSARKTVSDNVMHARIRGVPLQCCWVLWEKLCAAISVAMSWLQVFLQGG